MARALAFVLFLVASTTGFSAAITWGPATTVSGDLDATTNGTSLYAYAGRAVTVNGVAFAATANGSTWGNVSFTSFGGFNSVFGAAAAPFSGLTTAYSNVLSTAAWGSGTSGTVTLNGLTLSHSYSVQIWVNDSRSTGSGRSQTVSSSGGNTVTMDYNNVNVAGGLGQYTIGIFVADSTSQTFSVNGSPVVQINAIQVRDNGLVFSVPTNLNMPTRYNLAKYQPVVTDSTNGTVSAAYLTQGFVTDNSGWVSDNSGPHWAQVTFPFPVTVGSAQLAMGLNNASPLTVFSIQYLTNGNWVTAPGGTVSGNANVERNVVFTTPITASAFRVYDALDNPIRIRQFALYPPNGPGGFPFGTDFMIDVARKQPTFATANTYGNWPLLASDGLVNSNSAWKTTLVGSNALQINLQFTNKIGSAHLYSGMTGVPPLTNFVLQYWTGSAWANIPGGSVSGNTTSAIVIPFSSPVTTTKVQLVFTNASVGAVQELCIFQANTSGGYPLGTGIVSNTPVTAKYDTYSDSYYYLSNAVTAKVIVESNGVPVLGTNAIYTWANRALGWPAQYQVLLNYDTGTYRLINRSSGLCLAGAQLTTNAGVALVEEDYDALPDQDWFLQTVDGVSFYLVNQFSGLVADAQNGTLVQNTMTNSTAQLWQISLAQIFPKKGIAHTGNNITYVYSPGWCHDYGPEKSAAAPPGVVYYPADEQPQPWYGRGNTVAGNYWSLQPVWRTQAAGTVMLGYCEPDNTSAYFDPTNRSAVDWVNVQNLDLPLTAPAATDVLGTWIPAFLGVVTNWGSRFVAMPSHEYSGNSASGSSAIWMNTAQTAYTRYGLPIWMTEWNVVDWGGTGNWSEEDNYNAMAEFLWRVESVPWFQKYSLFVWSPASATSPMAVNPWTRTTPAPTGYCYDTNKVLTPFAELYGGWDDDANVETNKTYFIYNCGTRKQLANMADPSLPDAKNILVRDSVAQWTLQPSPTAGQYYIVSTVDGRRLNYNGTSVTLAASNTVGTSLQWSLTSFQYGWYYLDHPVTSKRLQLAYNNSTSVATFTMMTNTTTSTAVQWRFIVPYTPSPSVWTGGGNASWASRANWVNTQQTPAFSQTANNLVVFNNLSTNNLNTVLNLANNPAVSNTFTVYGITVSNVSGPVSISATNTLAIGNYIDLSRASQDLTISAPIYFGEYQGCRRQLWTVASGRSLTLSNSVAGADDLVISGGGTVQMSGLNTYGGDTTINAATLVISGSGQLGSGNYAENIINNGAFNYGSSADQNVSGAITGSGTVTVNGVGALTLTGTHTYLGSTTINSGRLALNGIASIASSRIVVAGGAVFDVSGLSAVFVLGNSCTLTNSSVNAFLIGSNNCNLGTLSLLIDGTNAAFNQTNGTMAISAGTSVKVNNTGAILKPGIHPLITVATNGKPGRVTGALPSVVVAGNGAAGAVSLQTNLSGGLDLSVTSTIASNPTNMNYTFANGAVTLTWPSDHLGWIAQSNSLGLANSNSWFDILGSQSVTNLVVPIVPANANIFYRLRSPN